MEANPNRCHCRRRRRRLVELEVVHACGDGRREGDEERPRGGRLCFKLAGVGGGGGGGGRGPDAHTAAVRKARAELKPVKRDITAEQHGARQSCPLSRAKEDGAGREAGERATTFVEQMHFYLYVRVIMATVFKVFVGEKNAVVAVARDDYVGKAAFDVGALLPVRVPPDGPRSHHSGVTMRGIDGVVARRGAHRRGPVGGRASAGLLRHRLGHAVADVQLGAVRASAGGCGSRTLSPSCLEGDMDESMYVCQRHVPHDEVGVHRRARGQRSTAGAGTTDAYCVAKYVHGQKSGCTRTVVDSCRLQAAQAGSLADAALPVRLLLR
uniref:Uncharacterized protein n=1 Tax=Oryza punctata TaxID=4537 RepID=A0A0E0LA83_ORYPU